MPSHADSHDRDKLSGWRSDLASGEDTGFPVCAVFLVTPEDRPAHDIFRAYRSSFGERGAAFQHLMIFGQHGISTTVKGLADEFGLTLDSLPTLALFRGGPSQAIHAMALRRGDYVDGEAGNPGSLEGPWMDVLHQLEDAIGTGSEQIDPVLSDHLTRRDLYRGPVIEVIERVLGAVS